MKVKLIKPENAPGLIDPVAKRSLFIDPTTGKVLEVADVPDVLFWHRLLLREPDVIVLVEEAAPAAPAQPVGDEPIKPLTTR